MNCDVVKKLLSAFVDAELSPTQTRQVREHLAGCEQCMDRLLDLHCLDEKLESAREPSISDSFTDEVMNDVREVRGRQRLRDYAYLGGLAASLLVGLFLGTWLALMTGGRFTTEAPPVYQVTGETSEQYSPSVFSESADESLAGVFVEAESDQLGTGGDDR